MNAAGIILETPRLILREWLPDDWVRFKPIATNPQVIRYVGMGQPPSDEQIRAYIEAARKLYRDESFCLWPLVYREAQELIGFCGFDRLWGGEEIEIGYWLAPDYWGKGLATEAAQAVMRYGREKLGLRRVVAVAHPENKASIRVLEKLGMVYAKNVTHEGVEHVYYQCRESAVPRKAPERDTMMDRLGHSCESQIAYWNGEGATKTFTHPVKMDWLQEHLKPDARILDYGCGYGRVAATLSQQGYQVIGVDSAAAMIEKARGHCPQLSFQQITPPRVPFDDSFFDAAVLLAVLTCIPADDDQRAVVNELHRVVRPGGLLYISDYWLQADQRNRDRYAQYEGQYRTYGVFEVSQGVAVRHHSRQWIASLLGDWEQIVASDIQVVTMNGSEASGFQWLGKRPLEG